MNPESIDKLVKKNIKLRNKREALEAMKDGAYCLHGSWGFGQIKSYNEATNRLIIDFEGKPGHAMDPAFCVDKLEILEDDNLLVRYRTDKSALEEEMKADGGAFVVNYISKKPDQSASQLELERVFKQLFGFKLVNTENVSEVEFDKANKSAEKAYRAWWNKVKEQLFRNPNVACPKTKNEAYVLRSEEEALRPEQEVLKEYFLNREPKKKILLAEKLYKTATSDGVEEIKSSLEKIKDELTEAIKKAMDSSKGLSDADCLHGIWVRNNLIRHLYEDDEAKVDEIAPQSKDIILKAAAKDPKDGLNNLAKNLPTSYIERFLDLLTRIYIEDWREKILDLLKHSDGRLTKECIDFLLGWDKSRKSHYVKGVEIADDGRGTSRELIKAHLKKWLSEQTLNGPVIYWIVKNRNIKDYSDMLEDLIGEDLFSALLAAIDDCALQRETTVTTAKIPLAEELDTDRTLVSDLLDKSTAETARDLAQTLMLNQGFEELTKKSILARFIKKFPMVQTLVASKSEAKDMRVYVSEWSLSARREELEDIVKNQLPASKIAIEAARELGDLRENSEYKMAREHDELLCARRAQLERDISSANVFDFNTTPTDKVGIGSIVSLKSDKGELLTCSIMGAWDSNTDKNIFSYQTPLAQALLEHKVGETVETNINNHITKWTIESLSRYIDSAK
ncbi:MAG: transcription elongation factor GreAB [Opitutales bacterium]|nr:transcription elongation factor GreAB [Opitutales bacterium]